MFRETKDYNNDEVPKNVKIGILIGVVWKFVVFIIWCSLKMFQSDYYRFGPSDTLILAFVDIVIDTYAKYFAILFYIILECIFEVIGGDFVYPWINAVVMNPTVPIQPDKRLVFGLTNFYWGLNTLNNIFFFSLTVSQVDLALVTAFSSTLAGMVSSYYVIFDKKRLDRCDSTSGETLLNHL